MEVLWEEKLSYYDLIEIKVTEGEASFNSELQNNPIDPDNATFNPEWFDYYEPELMDWKSSEFVFVGANDPSLGKNKRSDTSSIINIALSTKTGYMYVVDASVEKRKPDVIIEDTEVLLFIKVPQWTLIITDDKGEELVTSAFWSKSYHDVISLWENMLQEQKAD